MSAEPSAQRAVHRRRRVPVGPRVAAAGPWLRGQLRRLHRDEGGNVLVLVVVASLLLVAMLWAIIGTGQRLVQKETIQSSADAAAFSAAVIKAKGLNLIAFCNLVMALLFAIIMLLRALKYVLVSAAVVLSAACLVPYTAAFACGPAGVVDEISQQFSNWEPRAEDLIKQAMNGLSQTERAVAKITPVLSLVEAYHVGTDGAYKKNFSKGTLVTVSYPLPTTSLPVEDGTCKDLSNNASQYIGDLTASFLTLLGGRTGSAAYVAGIVGGLITDIIKPFAGLLCDGGSMPVPSIVRSSDCSACSGKAMQSIWTGTRVAADNPDGPGTPGATCVVDGMPWGCGGTGGPVSCLGDSSGRYKSLTFQSCDMQQDSQATNSDTKWPKPLVLSKDWSRDHELHLVRAFTVLTDANLDARRRAVGIATRHEPSAPALNQLVGMAAAEIYGFNGGHEDLWHMDWRARLVRFTFGSSGSTSGGLGDAAGSVPAGASDAVTGALGGLGGGTLQDQFLLH